MFSNVCYRLLALAFLLILVGNLIEENILFKKFDHRHAEKVQRIFLEKERQLNHYAEQLAQCTLADNFDSAFVTFHQQNATNADQHGLSLFIYHRDNLYYWTTHDVPIPDKFNPDDYARPFVKFGQDRDAGVSPGRYAAFIYPCGEWTIVGLILIKNIYIPENKYLDNSFQDDFGLPSMVKIFPEKRPNYEPIYDSGGRFIWSLVFDETCHYGYQTVVPAILYLIVLLVLFTLVDTLIRRQRNARRRNMIFPFLLLGLVALRLIIYFAQMPRVLATIDLFQPTHFGSSFFPSLGNQLLTMLFITFFIFELYRHFQLPLFWKRRWAYFVWMVSLLVLVTAFYLSTEMMLKTLVVNSTDMFEAPNRYLILNAFTLCGYFSTSLLLLSFCMMLDKTVAFCTRELRMKQLLIVCSIGLVIGAIAMMLLGWTFNPLSIALLMVLFVVSGVKHIVYGGKFRYSHWLLLTLILSIFFTVHVHNFSTEKYREQKKVLILDLASPHDLDAEYRLREISNRIISDTLLTSILYRRSDWDVHDYLKRTYFAGSFWTYYTSQAVTCTENDRLRLEGGMIAPNCVGYMTDILKKGVELPFSQFYYINRQQSDQLASYMGWFIKERKGYPRIHLFFELWTGGDDDDLGYPELLLDGKLTRGDRMKGYAYARYRDNRRISQSGSLNYPLSGNEFLPPDGFKNDYYTIKRNRMEHIVYWPDKSNMIVLSSHVATWWSAIINFSYIFIFSFLLVSLASLFYVPSLRNFGKSLRNRIQFSMIFSIILSFGIIGIFTFVHLNRQYGMRHRDMLNVKMQSVSRELQNYIQKMQAEEIVAGTYHRIIPSDYWLAKQRDQLSSKLVDLRSLFLSDINIYSATGRLVATSLPEVFDRRLVSRQMSPEAFIQFKYTHLLSAMNTETIGKLNYLSAYEAIFDADNNVIAFLNLPYFTQQDELREELSGLLAAIINFYIIVIFLTVIISIVIGKQITYPLNMLQEKFKNIKLGANNDPIRYYKDDEIGHLVREYNRAIDELARSAAQLARSERESAWRDMAKQIAHEINNPLTPMKLSIQHLKRAWDNQSERFGEYMEKISHSLIEQIDTLSTIATGFSNFAKMPTVNNQPMDVIKRINDVVPLFATGENKRSFTTNFHGLERAMIFADKEQISRVFINLIKNALQAIPKEKKPDIRIDVLIVNRVIWIRIKDNGPGIPKEMQDKIFKPNFTTKSSGMGIGLAIVRNTIEGAGGNISFQTKPNEGTTFIISIPEYFEQ